MLPKNYNKLLTMLLKIDKLTCSIKLQDIKIFVITFCKKLKKCSYMQYPVQKQLYSSCLLCFIYVCLISSEDGNLVEINLFL
jgi:hypothetical protein